MNPNGPVIWCDGLFLRPPHFQQLERATQARADARFAAAGLSAAGFTHLRLDAAALLAGRVGVAAAEGVMPDGTPFVVPDESPAPLALEWPADRRDGFVHLVLPLARVGGVDVAWPDTPRAAQARWLARDRAVIDNVLEDAEPAEMALGELQLRLDAEPEPAAGHCRLAIARVVERRPGGAVVLDDDWIAPCLDCRAVPPLHALLREAAHLMRHRAEALASRWPASASQIGHAVELPLLQAVNRYDAWLGHLSQRDLLPPEALHAVLVQAVGELAAFDERRGRRARDLPPWRHDDPRASLSVLMAELRVLLADVLDPAVVALPMQSRAPGLWTATVPEADLLRHATFVLVAASQWPEDVLRRRFPAQAKIGSPDRLRDLVRQHLPAIELRPLSVVPPRLPYRPGACYFELVRDPLQWQPLEATRALALHVAGEFPALQVELWALRS